ncbi:MAG: division/cell wall cluster transcriptional repressor MraZ [Bacteroidetes bacterium RIFCSPLOWO2_02_FULL_36_8]|nr:MAG: division/cell wall cluster transcriptional repressor MraZ [Bacteroidetes bacterium RIFCSPLOWO2_02_FULL_36_8]OFY70109.1 MAG: division/cell wall cluster transcriptional repressor MraZ [Bacteroidetes bacterium RIFCSPLOWO2_12_FULL_37_12]
METNSNNFLSGEYECKVDAKGRMSLPFKLKAKLPKESENKVILNRGFEPCLVLYSVNEWEKVYTKVAALNEFNEEDRVFQRNFGRGNSELELDNLGRIMLPKTLMKHASIESDVIVIGLGNRMEVWSPAVYEQYLIKDQKEFSKLAQNVLGTKGEKDKEK